MTASFHEACKDLVGRLEIKLNTEKLHKNYRSNTCIVHLANLMLLIREKLIGNIPSFQKAWKDLNFLNNKILFEKDFDLNELSDYLNNNELIIILPVEEGEEEDFLKNDSIFSRVDNLQREKFYTVSQVKGLEFPNVGSRLAST